MALLALPALHTVWRAWNRSLGADPLAELEHASGRWALILLLAALAVTPARHALAQLAKACGRRRGRRISDWNALIRLRRDFGLGAFFYALAHLGLYVGLDIGFDLHEFATDLAHKPFIVAGLACFVLLLPLAVTSTQAWMRRLRRNWKRLHRLAYAAGVLAIVHFAWLTKPGIDRPYRYAAVLAFLLLYRVAVRYWPGAGGSAWLVEQPVQRPPGQDVETDAEGG